jgi:hypothetical protein
MMKMVDKHKIRSHVTTIPFGSDARDAGTIYGQRSEGVSRGHHVTAYSNSGFSLLRASAEGVWALTLSQVLRIRAGVEGLVRR